MCYRADARRATSDGSGAPASSGSGGDAGRLGGRVRRRLARSGVARVATGSARCDGHIATPRTNTTWVERYEQAGPRACTTGHPSPAPARMPEPLVRALCELRKERPTWGRGSCAPVSRRSATPPCPPRARSTARSRPTASPARGAHLAGVARAGPPFVARLRRFDARLAARPADPGSWRRPSLAPRPARSARSATALRTPARAVARFGR